MAAQIFSCIGPTPIRFGSLNRINLSNIECYSSKLVVSPMAWRICSTTRLTRRADSMIVTATSNESDQTEDAAGSSSSPSLTESAEPENARTSAAKASASEKRAKAEAEVKKGQTTAIITGAVAVLLGVAYLVLVQLLDTRGIILIPPPPEAFNF